MNQSAETAIGTVMSLTPVTALIDCKAQLGSASNRVKIALAGTFQLSAPTRIITINLSISLINKDSIQLTLTK